ncbi:MAG: UDP-N-acetylglucosamine 2-epimerase (non-hydrolyzing) [Candidatus Omnitrophota bacterium]|jgi:UDP-N-acetylglucosamine 2-epimerase (non-hydrolysing)
MSQKKYPKICLIFGTRPEIIKFSPIIRYLQKNRRDYVTLHTSQHYSHSMDKIFFNDLNLPQPTYHLKYKNNSRGKTQIEHITLMMNGIESILKKSKPDICLVQGDTNTVLAGAFVTNRLALTRGKDGLNIKLGHVEAGLRSFDREMPEEVNRIIADNLSDYLYVPSVHSKALLLKENVNKNKIFLTGNTVVDAVKQNLKIAQLKSNVISDLNLRPKYYAVLTLHRPENVDQKEVLKRIFSGLDRLGKRDHLDIIFPIHPRTKKQILAFKLNIPKCVRMIEPIGYLDFLVLELNARILLTDSGGVQEEASIMHVPCMTLRNNTERPETVAAGVNTLCGSSPTKLLAGVKKMLNTKFKWKALYGDGRSGERIVKLIDKECLA